MRAFLTAWLCAAAACAQTTVDPSTLAWQQMLPPPGAYADYQFFDTQDSSGNARHGTLIGAAALGGGSLYLDGSTAMMAADMQAVSVSNDFTVALWACPSAVDLNICPVSTGDSQDVWDYFSIDYRPGHGAWRASIRGGTEYAQAISGVQAVAGRWDHLVATYSPHVISIWVNGSHEASGTNTAMQIWRCDLGTLGALRRHDTTLWFPGRLGHAMVYDRVLDPEEIQQLYLEGPPE